MKEFDKSIKFSRKFSAIMKPYAEAQNAKFVASVQNVIAMQKVARLT